MVESIGGSEAFTRRQHVTMWVWDVLDQAPAGLASWNSGLRDFKMEFSRIDA